MDPRIPKATKAKRPNRSLWDNPIYRWFAAVWPGNETLGQPRIAVLHYALGRTRSTTDPTRSMAAVVMTATPSVTDPPPCEADLQAIEQTIREVDVRFWAAHPMIEVGERRLLLEAIIAAYRYGIGFGQKPLEPLP